MHPMRMLSRDMSTVSPADAAPAVGADFAAAMNNIQMVHIQNNIRYLRHSLDNKYIIFVPILQLNFSQLVARTMMLLH